MPVIQKAFDLHAELIQIKKNLGIGFLKLGNILKIIRDEGFYTTLDYVSFNEYLASPEVSISYRTAFYYIDIWETFVEKLGYKMEELSEYSYDKLRRLLPVVKKEKDTKEVMEKALALRWSDFNKEYRDGEKNKGFPDYLAPPEYWRCKCHNKWVIVCPVNDLCPEFATRYAEEITVILGRINRGLDKYGDKG